MLGIVIQVIIFLLGLITLLVIIVIGIRRRSTSWMLASSIGLILMIVSVWMGSWKVYQCRFTTPDQITFFGHVKDYSNSYLDNHLVILYRGNEEIKRDITRWGKFNGDKTDKENNGYFEFGIPNTNRLNRCSMAANFKQASFGHDFLWFENKITYIWHNFTDIKPGVPHTIQIEDGNTEYNLEVLPGSQDNLPPEIFRYPTYLNQNGKVTIDVPIKTYNMQVNSPEEKETGFSLLGMNSSASKVRNAWVKDNTTYPSSAVLIMGEDSIDINNCNRPSTAGPVKKTLVFVREVQFQPNVISDSDLGIVALKANPSLGFIQGEIDTEDAIVDVDVPFGEHKVYKLIWQEVWRTGVIEIDIDSEIDIGSEVIQLPFRAKNVIYDHYEIHPVDCP